MNYLDVGVTLTDCQKRSLIEAHKKKQPIVLRLSKDQLAGYDKISLTKTQHDAFIKHKNGRIGMDIRMSKSQVQKVGGSIFSAIIPLIRSILPSVLPALGSLGMAAATGAISGATHNAVSGAGHRVKNKNKICK